MRILKFYKTWVPNFAKRYIFMHTYVINPCGRYFTYLSPKDKFTSIYFHRTQTLYISKILNLILSIRWRPKRTWKYMYFSNVYMRLYYKCYFCFRSRIHRLNFTSESNIYDAIVNRHNSKFNTLRQYPCVTAFVTFNCQF